MPRNPFQQIRPNLRVTIGLPKCHLYGKCLTRNGSSTFHPRRNYSMCGCIYDPIFPETWNKALYARKLNTFWVQTVVLMQSVRILSAKGVVPGAKTGCTHSDVDLGGSIVLNVVDKLPKMKCSVFFDYFFTSIEVKRKGNRGHRHNKKQPCKESSPYQYTGNWEGTFDQLTEKYSNITLVRIYPCILENIKSKYSYFLCRISYCSHIIKVLSMKHLKNHSTNI